MARGGDEEIRGFEQRAGIMAPAQEFDALGQFPLFDQALQTGRSGPSPAMTQ